MKISMLGAVALAASLNVSVFGADLPPDSEYVRVSKDGRLEVNGQRQRYWSAIGRLTAKTRAAEGDSPEVIKAKAEHIKEANKILIQRLQDCGFNSVRLWDALADMDDYTPGDASYADAIDNFIFQAKNAGMKIWVAGMNRTGYVSSDDVNVIDDPATAEAWAAAIDEWAAKTPRPKKGRHKNRPLTVVQMHNNLAKIWDPRLERLNIDRMKAVAVHKNKYTGLRWCDDPVFGVWEITNEEWWIRRFLGAWTKLPDFFKDSLYVKWNDYLVEKYKTDDALKASWGKLLDNESLTKENIVFTPTRGEMTIAVRLNDGNDFAIAAAQPDTTEKTYGRDDFSEERAADVLEFLTSIWLSHKQRIAAELRPLGKSTRLCPWIFDTGIGYNIQNQFIHQHADAVAHDAYTPGWSQIKPEENFEERLADAPTQVQRNRLINERERMSATDGAWRDALKLPPGVCEGVPWLEHNRVEGKPYFCYETQIQQPALYRSSFPMQIATLASLQDWDWICWHYFAPADDVKFGEENDRPWDRFMDYTTGGHPQGYHYTYDEVQVSAMRAAAFIFRNHLVKPTQNPTQFIWGKKTLYHRDSMDYGGSYGLSGQDMLPTTYQYGVRIKIDPTRDDDEVIGPVVKFADRNTHNPYTPTKDVVIDWKKGFMKFDSEGSAMFTGTLVNYGKEVKFSDGVVLSNVKMHNPEDAPYPIGNDEKYITFNLYAEDGDTLADAKKISLSLVSTSMNKGYKLPEGFVSGRPMGVPPGGDPVVTRVSGTLKAPVLKGATYKMYDWHMNVIGEGKVKGKSIDIPADKPIFYMEFTK